MRDRLLKNLTTCAVGSLVAVLPLCAAAYQGNPRPGPAAATLASSHGAPHVQTDLLAWDQRPPLPSTRDHLRDSYDDPRSAAAPNRPTGTCDIAGFASASGSALVGKVRAADAACFYSGGLFDVTGTTAGQIFVQAKMITIANAMQADAATYPGTDANHMAELVLFLRAGLYVQYYNTTDVGVYDASWTTAIRAALNAFVASSHFEDVNDDHGKILAEFVTLIDSAAENANQLATVRGILDRYGPPCASFYYMKAATNNVFNVLFRGHQNADFQALVQAGGSGVLDTLVDFINNNRAADVGTDREYLLQNAAGELGRFTQYTATTFHNTLVHPKVKSILDQFAISGPGAGVYVRIASVTDNYDHAHCAYFGLCTFAQDLESIVLPPANARDCSATLRVRSQALTSAQLDTVCSTVGGEEGYFHTTAQTNHAPVADDNNTKLEMVIFHSSTDYETYSGILFGNDTNNGGIYLEGDPSNVANQPRFLAYEAEWLRPAFEVWNLTHEYIHYLDGRFNWYGAFGDYPLDAPYSAVWYIEGFAEYMSYSYRNLVDSSAVGAAANPDTYTMAQLFDNTYEADDTARTYYWGYMATRFMFERHRDQITSLYAIARPGTYDPGYHTWLDAIRNSDNVEFRAWVVCFGTNNGDTSSCGGSAPDKIFANGFDGTGDGVIPECTSSNAGRLDNGCKRSNLSAAAANARVYLTILVPAGKSTLQLDMSGGTGDADIYVRAGNWPSESVFDEAPQLVGSNESVTITNPASGWYYLMLKPHVDAFDGVQVAAAWQ
ncbi:MAG: M9 family metallopeptidase [Dokdonella sp.]